MTNAARVPQNMQELIDNYDSFISWTIRETGPRMSEEDREDLKQDVYARIIRRDFLTTSAEYYKTHPGKFTSSLHMFVRNLTIDAYRRERRRGFAVPLPDSSDFNQVDLPKITLRSHGKLVELRRDVELIRGRMNWRMQQIVDVLEDDPQASSKEIAQRLRQQGRNIDHAAVRWYLTRIRRMARQIAGDSK